MLQFYETVMGRRFFDAQLPKLIKGIETLSEKVEALSNKLEALEKTNNAQAKMSSTIRGSTEFWRRTAILPGNSGWKTT